MVICGYYYNAGFFYIGTYVDSTLCVDDTESFVFIELDTCDYICAYSISFKTSAYSLLFIYCYGFCCNYYINVVWYGVYGYYYYAYYAYS